jgi:hypothetical protein
VDCPVLRGVPGGAAGDVLNIRAEPDARAAMTGTLPCDAPGTEVVAVEGDWTVLNAGESTGHAALRFPARTDAPEWNALQTPLTCLRAEPFRLLAIHPGDRAATLSSPDGEDGIVHTITRPGTATPAAIGLPAGTVVPALGECPDRMSDRRHGIQGRP